MPALMLITALLVYLLWPYPPVLAEPLTISALITLGVSAEIAAAVAPFVTWAVIGGLALGLSALFGPDVPKPAAGRTPFRQPVPPRIRILGARRSAGAQMLYHSRAGSTFFGIIAVCEGRVKEFTRYYLHDDVVTVLGGIVQGINSSGPNRYGDDHVHIDTRKGKTVETAYAQTVSNIFPLWTNDHRGDGIASAQIIASDAGVDDQPQRFPFGVPVLSVVADATEVYDPRAAGYGPASFGSGKGSNASGGMQDWRHSNTWSFAGNDNPILQAMWFVTAPIKDGGMGLDFEECFSTVLQAVADQADVCDEAVPLKAGGTQKRYTSAVLYHFSDPPSDVLSAILGTCDGFMAERGDGAFELKAGKWDDEDFEIVIRDKHILSLNVRRFRPDEDEVTGIIVKYTSVPHEYTEIDAPVWPRDAYQGGEDRRVRTIDVTYCNQGVQAQRLGKRTAIYEMARIAGTMVLNMYGVLLLDRRGCSIQCTDDPELEDCKAKLVRVEPNLMDGTVTVDFIVFDPVACDSWDPATEEGPLQPVVTVPVDDAATIPSSLQAVPIRIGGNVYVEVAFDPGAQPDSTYDGQWRVVDVGGGVPGPWTTQTFSGANIDKSGGTNFWIVLFTGLPIDNLEFHIRGRTSSGYSASAFADTGTPAPGRPVSFTAVLAGADVNLDWTSPNSPNFDHARVYRAISGAGFGAATDISGPIAGAANSAQNYTDTGPASNTYDYWVAAETAANLSSLPRGPETVTVP